MKDKLEEIRNNIYHKILDEILYRININSNLWVNKIWTNIERLISLIQTFIRIDFKYSYKFENKKLLDISNQTKNKIIKEII